MDEAAGGWKDRRHAATEPMHWGGCSLPCDPAGRGTAPDVFRLERLSDLPGPAAGPVGGDAGAGAGLVPDEQPPASGGGAAAGRQSGHAAAAGHGRYAQYDNARWGRTGHLWQSRSFACSLGPAHLWRALAYVERNPVRAGMVTQAADYRWSSARAHLTGGEADGIVDMEWWEREKPANWEQVLGEEEAQLQDLRQCTYAGRPFGDEAFMNSMRERFGRTWQPGRPRKPTAPTETPSASASQLTLFG